MKNELVEKIASLVQLDFDAVKAYEQALDNVEHATIHKKLSDFKDDHIEHIDKLSKIIKKLGGKVPEKNLDIKGFFISGFTAIRSLTGTAGALKAMKSNEKLTTSTYEDALDWDMPESIRDVIKSNFNDEKKHLKYIEDAIEKKLWE